ncbi:DUF1542 domain-containing protein [Croceitalea rosinachiae]|uniref:DUF1542 domain-containing protein n=1 Tax=Croceitalea rosinachiae TaxID=3075596 RepID=A0ABU3A5P7_9FLAO|nr:hypothetical protein [Croceitalea sp. F388]MDT0605502.1 hypothetical protein [Croceitalea sp. F388]
MKLKIHSEGQKDHLQELKEKYDQLKTAIKANPKLTDNEKQTGLKKMNEKFVKEKKDSNQKLF